jgi:hypothetical protein
MFLCFSYLLAAGCSGTASSPLVASSSPSTRSVKDAEDSSRTAQGSMTARPPVVLSDRGPYFVMGSWHGYFWLAQHGEGTSITAANFDMEQFAAPICIRGVVAATADNTANALLGLNLNQNRSADMVVQTVAPTRDGIRVEIANSAGSVVLLQVQAPDGATNERARWCAEVSGSGGFVPWTAFNTACWDGTGIPYQREPISGAMLLIPGTTSAQTTFDVCLVSLAEASAPASVLAAGSGS